jgi:hypothetical protein
MPQGVNFKVSSFEFGVSFELRISSFVILSLPFYFRRGGVEFLHGH